MQAAELESLKQFAEEHHQFAWSIKIEEANSRTSLYCVPGDGHFQHCYKSDSANQKKQTWTEYEGWIKTFYSGNFLVSGWKTSAEKFCSKIQSETERKEAIRYLNVLGRIIAAEWAKDAKVSRISSADVQTWAAQLDALPKSNGKLVKPVDALKQLAANISTALTDGKQMETSRR